MNKSPDLITAEELAARLRVQPDTIRVWSRRGLIPRVQLSPKVIRYNTSAVIEALTRRREHEGGDDE